MNNAASQDIIDVDADDDNDEEARFQAELQRAIAASKQEANHVPRTAPQPPIKEPAAPTASSSATSFLSERAQLERERRERQKRLRPDIYSGGGQDADHSDEEVQEVQQPNAKRQRISSSSVGARRANAPPSTLSSTATSPTAASSRAAGPSAQHRPTQPAASVTPTLFFDGELRQTANKHVDPQKDRRPVFRLSEILAPVSTTECVHLRPAADCLLAWTERRYRVCCCLRLLLDLSLDLLYVFSEHTGYCSRSRSQRHVYLRCMARVYANGRGVL